VTFPSDDTDPTAHADHGTVQARNKAVVHEYHRLKNDRDWDALDAVMSPDFRATFRRFYGGEEDFDVSWLKAKFAEYTEVFPDLHHETFEMVAEDDWVLVRLHYTGTHSGRVHGVDPTGKVVDVHQHLSFRLVDGRIVEMHSSADLLGGFWGRIGVTPIMEIPHEA
jgi:predicted ester cyclase